MDAGLALGREHAKVRPRGTQEPTQVEDNMQFGTSGFRGLTGVAAVTALAFGAGLYSLSVSAQPKLDIHFVPTPHEVVKRMLEIAKVGPNDTHYDLGSGDGRIVIAAVKDFKAKKGVGIDLDPQRIKEANENKAKAGVGDTVTFREQNIFETDLSEATTVSMYLLTSINIRMRPKLIKELKPGTRIVTHAFNMGEWKAEHDESVNGYQVYLFIVPANPTGKWEMSEGERKISLDLKSDFTDLGGTAAINGKSSDVKNGKITGTKIEFTIDVEGKPVKYEGTIDGSTITGAGATKWTAKKS
jgi:precorrin-6B methylase 2